MLLNLSNLEKISAAIASALPTENAAVKREIKNNIKPVVASLFKKMDLVTREDFELQKSILLKTREKIDILEAKLAKLEDDS